MNNIYLMEDDEWDYWMEQGGFPLIFMGQTIVKLSTAPRNSSGGLDWGALEKELEARK